MEHIALADYHFSLHIPLAAWVDHVNNLYGALLCNDSRDDAGDVVLDSLDYMVTEARDAELADITGRVTPASDRRLSVQDISAAGEQATSRDWGTFARTYSINDQAFVMDGFDLAQAEQNILALVGEDEEEELDEDEFLDYDGAVPFLPSASELRRSASNSSAQSIDSVAQWRAGVSQAIAKPTYRRNAGEGCPECAARGVPCSSGYPVSAPVAPVPPTTYAARDSFTNPYTAPQTNASFKETGIYLEPGIAIMRPPTALPLPPLHRYNPAYGHLNAIGPSTNQEFIDRLVARRPRW